MVIIRVINNYNECFYMSEDKEYEFSKANEYEVDNILDNECELLHHEENDNYGLSRYEVSESTKKKIESLALY